jgi:hypothetical protein
METYNRKEVYCKCGCGRLVEPYLDKNGFVSYYKKYYSPECRHNASKTKKIARVDRLCLCGCGRIIPAESSRKYYEHLCSGRKYVKKLRTILPDEERPLCKCGCMELVEKDSLGNWKKYVAGHFVPSAESLIKMHESVRFPKTEEHKRSISEKMKQYWLNVDDNKNIERTKKIQESRRETIRVSREQMLSNPPLCLCGCGFPVERKGTYWAKYIDGHYLEYKRKIAIEKRGIAPKCLCGCGLDVSWSKDNRRWNKYYGRHFCKSEEYRDNMSSVMNSPEKKAELSQKSKDNYSNPDYVQKSIAGKSIKPSGFERLFESIKPDMFIKYVGDFKLWIELPNGKPKNPDFIIEGTNKVIELHGDYWHKGEDDSELIALYKQIGYNCLVIWEHEMKDIKSVIKRVMDFMSS